MSPKSHSLSLRVGPGMPNGTTKPAMTFDTTSEARPIDDVEPLLRRRADARAVAFDDLSIVPRLVFLATGVRWATVGLGAGITLWRDVREPANIVCALTLAAFALWQTIQPPSLEEPDRSLSTIIGIELGLSFLAATLTGGLESPYVLAPMVPLLLAGFAWASNRIIGLAYSGLAVVGILGIVKRASPEASRSAVLLGVVLLLCSVLGAFTRRLIDETSARHAAALDQVTRMARANELLVDLHALAQTLPTSLDLAEVGESTRARLRELFAYTALTVLVRDEHGGGWRVQLAEGVRLPATLGDSQLCEPMRHARDSLRPHAVGDLLVAGIAGSSPVARSGIYAPLRARGNVVGLIAVEQSEPNRYGTDDSELLASFAGPLALSLDNALWFSRLRIFGAETERARIARDLHDRIAQSLAYVAFELERLADSERQAPGTELADLRDVVRSVVTELRDTLYELRAAVSTHDDLVVVATRYLDRYRRRCGLAVDFSHDVERRPPVAVEQELWRIAQEALENSARHARAERVRIRYAVVGTRVALEVTDDGRGFTPQTISGDHYGIVGMRERADAIGARMDLESRPGRGTRIRVELEVRP